MQIKNILSELRLYICNHIIAHIPSHSIRLFYYRKVMHFKIGKGSTIFMNCKFDCAKGLVIGNYSVVNANCRLDSRGTLEIGDSVSISSDVLILTADHDFNSPDFLGRTKKVIINDYVWIGTRAMILPGTIVSSGAVVAAGAVVTKKVNAYEVVAGIPAKTISKRNNNLNYILSYKRLFQ